MKLTGLGYRTGKYPMKVKTKKIQVYTDENLYNKIIAESKREDMRPSVYTRRILNKHFSEVKS